MENEIEYCVECGISIFPNEVRYRNSPTYNVKSAPHFIQYKCKDCGRFSKELVKKLKKKK